MRKHPLQEAKGTSGVILSDAEITVQEENRNIVRTRWCGRYGKFGSQGYRFYVRQGICRCGGGDSGYQQERLNIFCCALIFLQFQLFILIFAAFLFADAGFLGTFLHAAEVTQVLLFTAQLPFHELAHAIMQLHVGAHGGAEVDEG
jgi:hypothetical protein